MTSKSITQLSSRKDVIIAEAPVYDTAQAQDIKLGYSTWKKANQT